MIILSMRDEFFERFSDRFFVMRRWINSLCFHYSKYPALSAFKKRVTLLWENFYPFRNRYKLSPPNLVFEKRPHLPQTAARFLKKFLDKCALSFMILIWSSLIIVSPTFRSALGRSMSCVILSSVVPELSPSRIRQSGWSAMSTSGFYGTQKTSWSEAKSAKRSFASKNKLFGTHASEQQTWVFASQQLPNDPGEYCLWNLDRKYHVRLSVVFARTVRRF